MLRGEIEALNRVQAVIHFDTNGNVLDANKNFLTTMGYTLDEILGKHHRIFVDPTYARSAAYEAFWKTLRSGNFESGEFKRIAHDGHHVWLQASYNPIFDSHGKLLKVVKFATDITKEKQKNLDVAGQIEAIHRTQGVIEFDLQGTILNANENFLHLMGYTLNEIRGQQHRIFVSPEMAASAEYKTFWENLRAGRPDARVFERFGKNGRRVWIQASYNPILDENGKPTKVVKFASDLTKIIDQTELTQQTAQQVAAATEEMSSSIGEISHNMELSREATTKIATISEESGQAASHLTDSMRAMERIVGLIHDIAGRVNMLALNATIEAARAGEAGRGFAVVAGEVKNLSDQTAKATSEIGNEIANVQKTSEHVVSTIQDTVEAVSQVRSYVSSIATAMEQQTAVTKEIAGHSSHMVAAVDSILREARKTA
ncbi:PAS domain S-box protein [Telmatobacter bradus]|uniref:methyl-accepting chemotaxis protein n=1 Tax=Telmatobacter bradus TaxID=474953 RepID=UPI003B43067C